MRILALRVRDVRNLEPLELEPAPRFNVFHGDNGQGKTNLLETIYVVAALRSFRTSKLADLLRFDTQVAHIGARVERGGLERVYELTIEPRSRRARIDGKVVRPLARYFGEFNVVLFAPEDLQLPRGAPADRRRFLDRAVFNRRGDFMPLAQDLDRVLRSRNALLREIGDGRKPLRTAGTLLDVYDEQFAQLAATVTSARLAYLDELRPRFAAAFEAIARMGIAVDLRYVGPDEVVAAGPEARAAALQARLVATRPQDIARGATSVGPHRDDVVFEFGGRDGGAFASQGQLRALVLAWKTAELDLLTEIHGEPPILLLDDVSSELDPQRNRYLFDFLAQRRSQCFITTTHPRHVLVADERVDHEVREGKII
ncbi:MAG: DNA replication/repair protein RecF [Kofleriaceae bacterium]|nr:DNA replication/repair protein RecF [Kofleriaceae bacterium]